MAATVYAMQSMVPTGVDVPDPNDNSPTTRLTPTTLVQLGQNLNNLFTQYKSDRQLAERRWLQNQRQYLGIYDADVEKELQPNRSRAYPRLTRVKCISILSRIMNLMFQGNDKNWTLTAAPWPDMTIEDVKKAVAQCQADDQKGGGQPQQVTREYVMACVKRAAQLRAKCVIELIDDQMQELGGDQTEDYVALNRRALQSGILYGMGVLRGPFARECEMIEWSDDDQYPLPKRIKAHKPMFEFLSVWDFYPDMSAKRFNKKHMDGYFVRQVMSRQGLRKLADREDFMGDQIKKYLIANQIGNYRPQWYESELRAMGVKANVNEQKIESTKYEILAYHGPVTGQFLQLAGEEVPEDKLSDDFDAEVWMLDGIVIKCIANPWASLGVEMNMIHSYCYDEDDTSPIGFGVPVAIRDSQMGVSAATRMLMDNASVVCGPNIEVNTDLMRPDMDVSNITAYKVWYREGTGVEAQYPAVRNVQLDAHIDPLMKIIELFFKIADMETFVGPATGGDMQNGPSEPFRTAAGASQLMGQAALPFKDMIRAFDTFTQSIVQSMITFNRKFNEKLTPSGDYNVIARGATSLMQKEARGQMADNLATTLTPDEKMYVDAKKLLKIRVEVRDMDDIMVDDAEASRREAQAAAAAAEEQKQKSMMFEAQLREALANAFKAITQGQKNTASADAESVLTAEQILERGMQNGLIQSGGMGADQGGAPGVQGGGDGDDDLGQGPGVSVGGAQDPPDAGGGTGVPPAPGGM